MSILEFIELFANMPDNEVGVLPRTDGEFKEFFRYCRRAGWYVKSTGWGAYLVTKDKRVKLDRKYMGGQVEGEINKLFNR